VKSLDVLKPSEGKACRQDSWERRLPGRIEAVIFKPPFPS
jgi:hypothetical protein